MRLLHNQARFNYQKLYLAYFRNPIPNLSVRNKVRTALNKKMSRIAQQGSLASSDRSVREDAFTKLSKVKERLNQL